MDPMIEAITALYLDYAGAPFDQVTKLEQSGSDRTYFRISHNGATCIATYSLNVKENNTFLQFSKHFNELSLPVPEVYKVNTECTAYLQQDLGTSSLLNHLEQHGHTEQVFGLFCSSLEQLARMQITGHQGFNYNWCITAKEFGKQAIMSDLLYFKYYFLDTLKLPYDKQLLMDDFEALGTYLTRSGQKYFMFRDFQSRNIIVNDGKVYFIDYQGGMQGALQYDVASLLWQAKAQLSEDWKDRLLQHYMDKADGLLEKPLDRNMFEYQYNGYVLIRLLQVIGAYGFRGLFERKAHFLASLPLALNNLKWYVSHKNAGIMLPEFDRILGIITGDDIIARFEPPQASEATPLVVTVNSFSYRKGIPPDDSGNGGGFVFDCRGILNPGRFEEYKTLSGEDKPVIDFLEQQTKMNEYLNSVFDLIDINVEDYLKRNFGHLSINFGCTGGQHRSVYAANQVARHLKNKYKVKVVLTHTNRENWVRAMH